MEKTITVIVARCDEDARMSVGARLFDETYQIIEFAKSIGEGHKKEGVVVIIRPNYNEEGFFREWRSFNGKPFSECRFLFG